MGMTMTQKILAAHAGLDSVTAGQLIEAKLDVVMANDITGPMALPIFRQMADKVFDKDKVVLVPDHFTPNKDIKSAINSRSIQDFAKEFLLDMSPAGRQVHFKAMRKLAAEHQSEAVGAEIRKLYSWNGEDKLINN